MQIWKRQDTLKEKKAHFRSTCIAQKRRCLNSLIGRLSNRDDGNKNVVGKTTVHVQHSFWYISLTSTAGLRGETS